LIDDPFMKQSLQAQAGRAEAFRVASSAPGGHRLSPGRVVLFYVLWIVLAGTGTPELWVGVPAALLSGWLSAKLLPAHGLRWRPAGLLWLGVRFVRDSLVAGGEIARVVLRPTIQIKPGFVSHRTRIPGAAMCAMYKSYNSLTPGTLAVEPQPDGSLVFHCLDVSQPVAESLAMNETALLRAVQTDGGGAHG
jgi:multicomponent Na+:H+ antiporter subunit E